MKNKLRNLLWKARYRVTTEQKKKKRLFDINYTSIESLRDFACNIKRILKCID